MDKKEETRLSKMVRQVLSYTKDPISLLSLLLFLSLASSSLRLNLIYCIVYLLSSTNNTIPMFKIAKSIAQYKLINSHSLFNRIIASFALPKHQILSMPALSPTMTEGKILKWLKKIGDKVQPGDAIAQIQTDKATMAFEVQQKGYIAKISDKEGFIQLGEGVAVITKKSDEVSQFANYQFGSAASETPPIQQPKPVVTQNPPKILSPVQASNTKEYPVHTLLQMPAVSPTMTEGKILKWKIQPGDSFSVGDALFSIETDKAVMDYEATQKGFLAKITVKDNQALPIGATVAVVVKKKESVADFTDFTGKETPSSSKSQGQSATQPQTTSQSNVSPQSNINSGSRIIASPLAKSIANSKGIDLALLRGSGPDGRILKQDVQSYVPVRVQPKVQAKTQTKVVPQVAKQSKPAPPKQAVNTPDNPYEQIALSSMRKTIANRLTESKQNVPHYYVSSAVEMDAIMALRTELNKKEKENGVKISINDIIIKAMALALRDYPNVNVQWHGTSVRKFKHADVSVAVAIDGGLITPIVYRAQTLGLLDIARRTKDVAKRAREGKLQPSEYIGGTTSISNLGMFGIDTVTSIINPPQATIIGVGKTQKKVLVNGDGTGPSPYRIAQVMELIVSVDHRAVDGALAAQWISRIKQYLQQPTQMLL